MSDDGLAMASLRASLQRLAASGSRDAAIANEIARELTPPGLFRVDQLRNLVGQRLSEANNVVSFVTAKSELVRETDMGVAVYRIKDELRRDFVRAEGLSVMLSSQSSKIEPEMDGLERLLLDLSLGANVEVSTVAAYGVETVLRAVRILKSAIETLPSETKVQSYARIIKQKSWIESSAGRIFVNRHDETLILKSFLQENTIEQSEYASILELRGPAGVGKTTIILRAIESLKQHANLVFIYLDFERPVSNNDVLRFVFVSILNALFDAGQVSERALRDWLKRAEEISDTRDMTAFARQLKRETEDPESNWVVFFDSVEIFLNSFGDDSALTEAIDSISEVGAGVKILVATRLSGLPYSSQSTSILLKNLTEQDIKEYCSAAGLDLVREKFVEMMLPEGNPLLATLLIEAVRNDNYFSFSDIEIRKQSEDLFHRYVLDRIIAKLPDQLLRDIALSAIPLRRITPSMLQDETLFSEIGRYATPEPDTIFERIRSQVIVFDTRDGNLVVRPEIRGTVLALGLKSGLVKFEDKFHAAYEHSKSQINRDSESEIATDILYYALMLNKSRNSLEEHWDAAAGTELSRHLPEFPNRSKAWLKRKLGRRWNSTDFREGFLEDVDKEYLSFSYNAFVMGRSRQVDNLLKQQKKSRRTMQGPGAVFAQAIANVGNKHWDTVRANMCDAVNSIDEQKTRLEVLAITTRFISLLSDPQETAIQFKELREFAELHRLKERDAIWWNAYLDHWAAAFSDDEEALYRVAHKHVKVLFELSRNSRPPIAQREVCELYLLASKAWPEVAVRWAMWVNTTQLSNRVVRTLIEFYNLLDGAKVSVDELPPMSVGGGERIGSRSNLKRQQRSVSAEIQPSEDALEVLRRAAFIHVSDMVTGLLSAEMSRQFRSLEKYDLVKIAEVVGKPLRSGVPSSAAIGSLVRHVFNTGNFSFLIRELVSQKPDAFKHVDGAVDNWSSIFGVDRKFL